jgi:hypothetical protein
MVQHDCGELKLAVRNFDFLEAVVASFLKFK